MAEIKRLSTELQVKDKLLDTSGDAGTSGQVLSSTGTGTNWITLTSAQTTGATFTGNINIDEQSLYFYNASDNYWRVQNNSAGKLVFKQATTQRGIWSSGELELTNNLIVSGGTLQLGSDVTLFRDGANILRTDDVLHANGHIHVGGASGGGNIYNRSDTSNYIGFSSNAIAFSKDATFAGSVDVNGSEITVGTNNSRFAENNLRFKSSGAAYIDHNTTGQSFIFRTSTSSSLDTTALTLTNAGNATFAGGISAPSSLNFTANTAIIKVGSSWNTGKFQFLNGATTAIEFDIPNNRIKNNLGKYLTASSGTGQFGSFDNQSMSLVTNNTARLTINTSGDATFSGNVLVPSGYVGRDSHNRINFDTDDSIIFRVADTYRVRFDSGAFLPYADSSYNLGSDAKRWASVYIDTLSTSSVITASGNVRLQSTLQVLNKAQTSYINLAARDTSGSEVVYNLSNLGTATFAGDVTVGGDLNITGDINSVSVTDLDVTDKTITVGKGQTAANSAGSGIAVERTDSTNPSLLWNQSTSRFDFNTGLTVTGQLHTTGSVYAKGSLFVKDTDGTNNHIQARSNGTEGFLTVTNGSNWGFIVRGPGNDPRIGAYHGGTLKIEGFHSSDGATGSNAIDFAQFQFGNDHFQMNAATSTFAGELYIPGYINHAGDSGTAIGFDADDVIRLKTASSTAMQIDSSQNVKVVAGKLQISGDNDHFVELVQSGNGDFTIDAPDDIRLDAGGGDIVLRAGGTEFSRLTFNNPGLHVQATQTNASIYLTPNGTGNVYASTDTFIVSAYENETAKILLRTDESDDDGDDWYITNELNNDLTFKNDRTGSQLANLTITPQSPSSSSIATFAGNVTVTNNLTANLLYTDFVQTRNGAKIDFRHQDGSVIMMIDTDDARVGIGHTAPNKKLVIKSSGADDGINLRRNSNDAVIATVIETGSGDGALLLASNSGSTTSLLRGTGTSYINSGTFYVGQSSDYFGGNTNIQLNSGSSSKNVGIRSNILYLYSHGNNSTSKLIFGDGSANFGLFSNDTEFALYNYGTATNSLVVNRSTNAATFIASVHLDSDSAQLQFGDDNDMQVYHNGASGHIVNGTGDLIFRNNTDDGRIRFQCDNGSGGYASYFDLQGSQANSSRVYTNWYDNSVITLGNGLDTQLYHDGTDTIFYHQTGDLIFKQASDNNDIIFQNDDGSGGLTQYFRLDGGTIKSIFSKPVQFIDSTKLFIGSSNDLEIFHDSSNTYIENYTGNFIFTQALDDGDMIFKCDNGSGGTTEYFRLDGGAEYISIQKNTVHPDSVYTYWGDANDFYIGHDSNNTNLINSTGHLYIANYANDSDIIFQSDDGSGGVENYIQIDGSEGRTTFNKTIRLNDNAQLQIGSSNDAYIMHNGTHTYFVNGVGNLEITNDTNDGDIIFSTDDGSGGVTQYYRIDGGASLNVFNKDIFLADNKKALFGSNSDLQIYHDGSDSYIKDAGTGNLFIQAAANVQIESSTSGENMAVFNENSAVELYYNNSKKFETTNTGINVNGDIADRNIPCIINTGWGDDSSTTSNIMVPLGNTVDDVSTGAMDGEHTFVAPYAGKIVKIIMKNTNGSLSTSFTTELKYYKNGSSTATSGELTASSSAITWAPTSSNTFAAGDEINILYQKSAGSKYWREVSMTIVIELTDYDI